MLGITNAVSKILPNKKGGAGGVLARTIGRALPNQHPLMVAEWRGLLLGSGVWAMSDTLKKINHYEYMLKELNLSERHRYWIEGELKQLRESKSVLCGDCLRSDCVHLEEARA